MRRSFPVIISCFLVMTILVLQHGAIRATFIQIVLFYIIVFVLSAAAIRILHLDSKISTYEERLKNVNTELQSSKERYNIERKQKEVLFSCMDEGVIVINNEGSITLANPKANEIFGVGLCGKRLTEISRNPEFHRIIEVGRKKHELVAGEIVLSSAPPIHLSLTITPLLWNKEHPGAIMLFHDISHLKKLEKMRIDFVANVSHEMKTPLTAIQGFAETLMEGGLKDGENASRFLGIIKDNTERLTRLVEDLLTLSHIELGKIGFDIGHVDVREATRMAISTLEYKADKKGIILKHAVEKDTAVLADKDKLVQILLNLIDNGIKFTDEGYVVVSSEKRETDVLICVKDTGIGIPKKDLHRIGERFYRVDPARSRDLGGTGLGLAIVKHLVASMGGQFTVKNDNSPSGGSKVCFTLPAAG